VRRLDAAFAPRVIHIPSWRTQGGVKPPHSKVPSAQAFSKPEVDFFLTTPLPYGSLSELCSASLEHRGQCGKRSAGCTPNRDLGKETCKKIVFLCERTRQVNENKGRDF